MIVQEFISQIVIILLNYLFKEGLTHCRFLPMTPFSSPNWRQTNYSVIIDIIEYTMLQIVMYCYYFHIDIFQQTIYILSYRITQSELL